MQFYDYLKRNWRTIFARYGKANGLHEKFEKRKILANKHSGLRNQLLADFKSEIGEESFIENFRLTEKTLPEEWRYYCRHFWRFSSDFDELTELAEVKKLKGEKERYLENIRAGFIGLSLSAPGALDEYVQFADQLVPCVSENDFKINAILSIFDLLKKYKNFSSYDDIHEFHLRMDLLFSLVVDSLRARHYKNPGMQKKCELLEESIFFFPLHKFTPDNLKFYGNAYHYRTKKEYLNQAIRFESKRYPRNSVPALLPLKQLESKGHLTMEMALKSYGRFTESMLRLIREQNFSKEDLPKPLNCGYFTESFQTLVATLLGVLPELESRTRACKYKKCQGIAISIADKRREYCGQKSEDKCRLKEHRRKAG